MISLVCLDMAGTTVLDGGVVADAFGAAVLEMGLEPGTERHEKAMTYAMDTMGQSKIDVFTEIFGKDTALAAEATTRFEAAYGRSISSEGVTAVPGAAESIEQFRSAGIPVVLTTGFSPTTRDLLIKALGWTNLISAAYSPADAGRGRPAPDMILTAMIRHHIDDVRDVAVAGDTTSDLLAGTRAGASIVAGVLTGAHDEHSLRTAPHTHLLPSIADLPAIVF